MKRRNLLLGLLAFLSNLLICGASFTEAFTIREGLPQNSAQALYIDSRGILWIGTKDGLCFFDGHGFTSYFANPLLEFSLSSDNILDITESESGNIVLLTSYGIEEFKLNEQLFVPRLHLDTDILWKTVESSTINEKYVVVSRPDSSIMFNLEKKESSRSIENGFFKDDLLLLEKQTLIRPSSNFFNLNQAADTIWKSNQTIEAFAMQPDGSIAICYAKRFIVVKDNRIIFQRDFYDVINKCWSTPNSFILLSGHDIFEIKKMQASFKQELIYTFNKATSIFDLLKDDTGIFWIGTDAGLYKVNPHSGAFVQKGLSSLISTEGILTDKTSILKQIHENNYRLYDGRRFSNMDFEDIGAINSYSAKFEQMYLSTRRGLYSFSDRELNQLFAGQSVQVVQHDSCLIFELESNLIKYCASSNVTDTIARFPGGNLKHLTFSSKHIHFILDSLLIRVNSLSAEADTVSLYNYFKSKNEIADVLYSQGVLFIATKDGLYKLNDLDTKIEKVGFSWAQNSIQSLVEDESNQVWATTNNGIGSISDSASKSCFYGESDGIYATNFTTGVAAIRSGKIILLSESGLTEFYPDSIFTIIDPPKALIVSATINNRGNTQNLLLLDRDSLFLDSRMSHIEIKLSALDYFSPSRNTYAYSFSELNDDPEWINIGVNNQIVLSRIPPGDYRFRLKVTNAHGTVSAFDDEIVVFVKAPIYATKLAFVIYVFLVVIIMYSAILFRTKQLRKLNREYKERERVAKKVEFQKEELTLKNKNITDSINYAKRIQMAMMPSKKAFKQFFPESFILHMPKDIVSGDFYWVNEVNGNTFFSAVDCTGHGVPGAFMSIIGFELFRKITEVEMISKPSEILNSLSKNFERIFGDVEDVKMRDGMDLAFCTIDSKRKVLQYSGAFNPLYIIRNNSIIEVKADRFSVGLNDEMGQVQSFQNHEIKLQEGDVIYIFTDGYADQFGGPEGKKYKYRRFRHLLLALHQLPLQRQEEFLLKSIQEWKGEMDQVDDILVMGIKIIQE